MLAHALTVVRRRMKENGQLIVAVEPPAGGGQLLLQTVKTSDGKLWWAAFTGFEEELRGSDRVKSTFWRIWDSCLQPRCRQTAWKGSF